MKETTHQIMDTIRGLILDMDGVLWRGSAPIGSLSEIFSSLKEKGYRFIFATNNATRSPSQYVEKLISLGIDVEPWQVINSAVVTGYYMKDKFPTGGEVYTIGEEPLLEILSENGFTQGSSNPIAVVAALDRKFTFEKLTTATLLIRRGLPFIGTNPDLTFPIPEGQSPGAGSILAALEAAAGVKPTIMGKPESPMYNLALERLGTSPQETLVVGDRLETDILGSQKNNCPCALVLTGVSTAQQGKEWSPPPDIIVDDLETIVNSLPGIPPSRPDTI
jgi:4-nitrophenyl phosphatase